MRTLITSVAAYGHLQPLLPLASALAGAGHEVASTSSATSSAHLAPGFA